MSELYDTAHFIQAMEAVGVEVLDLSSLELVTTYAKIEGIRDPVQVSVARFHYSESLSLSQAE